MTQALAAPMDREAQAQLHGILRFTVGTSAAFVVCEAMGWYPSFLAPLLAGTLLASLPVALPPKAGLALIAVMVGGAYTAYAMASLFVQTPIVLFGVTGLIVFICFAKLAQGAGLLPLLLILVCFSTVPVTTLVVPLQALALPEGLARGMIIAVVTVWVVFLIWPVTAEAPPPAPSRKFASPVAMAAVGTAIVLPLMLVFLLYGITDAFPLMITTVVLVVNFDPRRGAAQGAVMVIANLFGGMTAIFAFAMLQVAPNLAVLALIVFLIGAVFASQIQGGGTGGAVALLVFNQSMVIFGLSLIPGGTNDGLWMTRLFQFAAANLFAVGMLTLLLPHHSRIRRLAD
jgi:hypothetical protein